MSTASVKSFKPGVTVKVWATPDPDTPKTWHDAEYLFRIDSQGNESEEGFMHGVRLFGRMFGAFESEIKHFNRLRADEEERFCTEGLPKIEKLLREAVQKLGLHDLVKSIEWKGTELVLGRITIGLTSTIEESELSFTENAAWEVVVWEPVNNYPDAPDDVSECSIGVSRFEQKVVTLALQAALELHLNWFFESQIDVD